MPGKGDRGQADLDRAMASLARNRRDGSTTLAERALEAVTHYLGSSRRSPRPEQVRAASRALHRLAESQSPMALLSGMADAFDRDPEPLHLQEKLRRDREGIVDRTLPMLGRRSRVVTLSSSSEVYAVLAGAWKRHRLSGAFVAESLPGGEGTEQARRLASLGVPTILFPDAVLPFAVEASDLALIGADTVWEDGTALGKVGVGTLGHLCRTIGRPLYVTAVGWKVRSARFPRGGKARADLRLADTAYGLRARGTSHLFEPLPAEEIRSIITEAGPLGPPGFSPHVLPPTRGTSRPKSR